MIKKEFHHEYLNVGYSYLNFSNSNKWTYIFYSLYKSSLFNLYTLNMLYDEDTVSYMDKLFDLYLGIDLETYEVNIYDYYGRIYKHDRFIDYDSSELNLDFNVSYSYLKSKVTFYLIRKNFLRLNGIKFDSFIKFISNLSLYYSLEFDGSEYCIKIGGHILHRIKDKKDTILCYRSLILNSFKEYLNILQGNRL